MKWERRTTISVPPEVREELAEYRDEHGFDSYAEAIEALIEDAEGGDGA